MADKIPTHPDYVEGYMDGYDLTSPEPSGNRSEKLIEERFTEHDLRAKVGSDAESLERARALLAHADSRMTQKAYRRLPERVKPLR